MPRIPTPDLEDAEDDVIVPLTAQEVQALRKRQPLLSVWRVIVAQVLAGLLTAGLAGWWFGGVAAQSALFGSAAVAVPAALFALGLSRRAVLSNAGSAVFGFFLVGMGQAGNDGLGPRAGAPLDPRFELAGFAGWLAGDDEGLLGGAWHASSVLPGSQNLNIERKNVC